MTKILPKEYLILGNYLWQRVNTTDLHDRGALEALGKITFSLMESFEGKYTGFMHELNMWIGLKQDAPEVAKDYGEGMKKDFPEFFTPFK